MKPSELFKAIKEAITKHFQLTIVGPPGCGKTQIIAQVCKSMGLPLIISHPVTADPTDYKGFPYVDENGNARFVPFADLRKLIETKEKLVYFIDDAGQALPGTQAALMQLVFGGNINDHKISDKVYFIMASNRREDMAGVANIIEPLKSRFHSIIELEPDIGDWVDWAYKHNIDPSVIAFMKARPHYLSAFKPTADMTNSPCARTIEFASDWIKSDIDRNLLPELIAGCAGKGFSDEYISTMVAYANRPDLLALIEDPDTAEVPENADTMYAIVVGLVYMADVANVGQIFKYADRIGPEYQMALVTDLESRHPHLVNTAEYLQFCKDNQDLFL